MKYKIFLMGKMNRRRYHWDSDSDTTRMWANANVMAALLNVSGTLCSMPQTLADAHYSSEVQ